MLEAAWSLFFSGCCGLGGNTGVTDPNRGAIGFINASVRVILIRMDDKDNLIPSVRVT